MATYTMQLRTYIEQVTQDKPHISVNERIEEGRKKLFDFDYPIFDNAYRPIFETNFIKNFYFREIGFETESMFKMRLETWLNINMGYYNELFESETWEYDPLQNSQLSREYKLDNIRNRDVLRDLDRDTGMSDRSNTSGSETTSSQRDTDTQESTDYTQDTTQDNFNRTVSSDNPDSRLRLQTKQGKGVIEYASDISESKTDNQENQTGDSSTDSTQSETGQVDSSFNSDYTGNRDTQMTEGEKTNRRENDNEVYLEKRFGKVGVQSYPKLVMEYRQALLRVEVQIHKELQQLFMLVY